MAEDAKKKAGKAEAKKPAKAKGSWSKGLKTEWDKIVWTDKATLGKQTAAVVAISAVTCVLITLLDSLGLQIMQLLIK